MVFFCSPALFPVFPFSLFGCLFVLDYRGWMFSLLCWFIFWSRQRTLSNTWWSLDGTVPSYLRTKQSPSAASLFLWEQSVNWRGTWLRMFHWKTSNFQCWTSFSLGLLNIPERNGFISRLAGIRLCSWSQAGMKGLSWSWTWCTVLSDACFLYTQSPSTLISPGYNLENNPRVFCRYEEGAITTPHK